MQKQIYVLDGTKFSSLEEFAGYFSRVVLNDYEWHGNFNAFNDVLRGGFGTPIGGYILRWENSALSRERLGHAATVRWLKEHMAICPPSNVSYFEQKLVEMEEGRGETLFDTIIEIIQIHCPGGEEAQDGVELVLL